MSENNKIELKPISELLEKNFFIPSYQRGYRWGKQQVEDLLNDIDEFDNKKDGNFYCLQPLVVKEDKDNSRWIVIDGQQRLTTIYLILKCLGEEKIPLLEYYRNEHFNNLTSVWEEKEWNKADKKFKNIEFYHLFVSKCIIQEWFSTKDEKFDKVAFTNKLKDETKFIWYDVGESADEHKMFENLNSGKISLTNAELIKALFLNNVGDEVAGKELKQNLIAEEFDIMERELREDDFWYFIAGNQSKPSSCINLLFDLMLDTTNKIGIYPEKEEFRTFFYFKDLIFFDNDEQRRNDLDTYKKASETWEKVKEYFYTLQGWYKNAITYHLIGFLRALKIPKPLKEIHKLFSDSSTKENFITSLKEQCKSPINYPNFLELRFDKNKHEVNNLLLLLNIATLIEFPKEQLRFSFCAFHSQNWDVEHISPQNPKDNDALKKILEDYKQDIPEILRNLQELLTVENHNNEKIDTEKKKFFALDENDVMGLSNLTLLRDKNNRGIGNMFFFEKREKLKEYFQQGSFIPPCSMNVFVKFYSENPKQMWFWDEKDRNDYIGAIETTINNFFKIKEA